MIGTLRKIDIFAGLKKAQVDELLSWFARQEFPAHHQIFREGYESDGFYVLTSGKINVLKSSSKGHFRLSEIAAPSYFGEMGLLSKTPRATTIKCQTDVVVGFLSNELFELKVRAQNATALLAGVSFARVLSNRLYAADQEIARLTAKVARKRMSSTAASAAAKNSRPSRAGKRRR